MKRLYIVLLFIGCLFYNELSFADQEENTLPTEEARLGFTEKIQRSFENSDSWGNFLLFLASTGFLIYLPQHLSQFESILSGKTRGNAADYIIKSLRFSDSGFGYHLYYELLTLLAGYICLKTGRPYWEKLKNS